MKTTTIEAFKARLIVLGFDHAIEHRLRGYCCFAPQQFELLHCVVADDTKCFFAVQCVRGDLGLYDAMSYTATLIRLPELSGDDLLLSQQCGQVDWDAFYFFRAHVRSEFNKLENTRAAELAERFLEEDVTGKIRFRHWMGTSLEAFIPNLAAFKSEFEISQRFYLAGQADPFTFAEAVRFLQSKWTERKMLAERKALMGKRESGDGSGAAGSKLLSKRLRPSRKRGNIE